MVKRSDRMWSTGEGNGKPLQYSCLENPMNSMKRQNDRILKEELPRSVGAQYATGDQWRNNSRKNEGMESKQKEYPAVDVVTAMAARIQAGRGPPVTPVAFGERGRRGQSDGSARGIPNLERGDNRVGVERGNLIERPPATAAVVGGEHAVSVGPDVESVGAVGVHRQGAHVRRRQSAVASFPRQSTVHAAQHAGVRRRRVGQWAPGVEPHLANPLERQAIVAVPARPRGTGVFADKETAALQGFAVAERSEERRVGKECRSRWSPYH